MHSKMDNRVQSHKAPVKPKADQGKAPQVKHAKALEQIDVGGMQHCEHPAKAQSKILRHLRH